jgi:O-acetylhomoserine/O-acetylserine sulfhydrylase-like pyridoxal-dependent enzyme
MRTETVACHAGRDDFAALTVHAPPIDLSTTYPLHDLGDAVESFDALARGESADEENPIYARLHNPTVRRFERAIAELERTDDAVAYASGMAALTATVLAACSDRRHVVAFRPLYGGTDHLLDSEVLGLGVTWIRSEGEVARAVTPQTGLVLV